MNTNSFKFLFLVFALLIAACSSNSSSVEESSSANENGSSSSANRASEQELKSVRDVLDPSATTIAFYSCRSCDPIFIKVDDDFSTLDFSSTIDLKTFARDLSISTLFVDTSKCNYKNTKVFVDGKELKNAEYGDLNHMYFQNFLPSITEEHLLEIMTDSASCGNIKRHYRIVPSKEPGAVHHGNSTMVNGIFRSVAITDFNVKVFSDFVIPQLYVWDLDTLDSKCFLKHAADSVELDIEYQKDYDWLTASQLRYGMVSLDSAGIANLLKGDTLATLSCDVIYHDWIVHEKVDSLAFSEQEFIIKNYKKFRLESAKFMDDGMLAIQTSAMPSAVFALVTVNGKKKAFYSWRGDFYTESSSAFGHKIVSAEQIYGGLQSSAADSVQLIFKSDNEVGATVEENTIRNILGRLPYSDMNSSGSFNDSTISVLDSIINVITDEAGNIKTKYRFLDAMRIPGYERRN